ncbi:MAG: hypothetical protein JWL87_117 [Candidatus Adlerbacteria bacterium]|nr:hypothetical protein [Candidatus Adlerbacteria bacterium]
MKKAVATICSWKKRADPDQMPASQLYLGRHIAQVENIAGTQKADYYILSGRFGLLHSTQELHHYDYRLPDDEAVIEDLARKVGIQMTNFGITELDFYVEASDGWKPYISAMQKAAEGAGVEINLFELGDI